MKTAKVFAGWLNGTWTEIKAYQKGNAVKAFQAQNKSETAINASDICWNKTARNSGQMPVDADCE